MSDRLVEIGRRPVVIAVASTVALTMVVGLTAWRAVDASPSPTGARLAIALVAPVEPEVSPGEVMQVGRISDGFDRRALVQVADRTTAMDPIDAFAGEDWGSSDVPLMPAPTLASAGGPRVIVVTAAAPSPADPLADGSRHFGFDRISAAPGSDRPRDPRSADRDPGADGHTRPAPWTRLPAPDESSPVPVEAPEPTDEYSPF